MNALDPDILTSPLSEALAVLPIEPDFDISVGDHTLWPRIGIKGTGVRNWLAKQGLPHDLAANTAAISSNDLLVIMLAPNEGLITGPQGASRDTLPGFATGHMLAENVWPVPRDFGGFHLRLTGRRVVDGLARVCELDFDPDRFDEGRVAQTLIAGVAAIVVRADHSKTPAYHMFGDATFGDYLARKILAALERCGASIGRES